MFRLKTKYNTFNKELGFSGAGVTVEQMLEDPNKRNLFGMSFAFPPDRTSDAWLTKNGSNLLSLGGRTCMDGGRTTLHSI